jgi:hypothetical protein
MESHKSPWFQTTNQPEHRLGFSHQETIHFLGIPITSQNMMAVCPSLLGVRQLLEGKVVEVSQIRWAWRWPFSPAAGLRTC